jgi:hypothetical protein
VDLQLIRLKLKKIVILDIFEKKITFKTVKSFERFCWVFMGLLIIWVFEGVSCRLCWLLRVFRVYIGFYGICRFLRCSAPYFCGFYGAFLIFVGFYGVALKNGVVGFR